MYQHGELQCEGNARMYTDCLLMTAARNVVNDIHSVSTYREALFSVQFAELLVSPNDEDKFIKLINDEIKNKTSR